MVDTYHQRSWTSIWSFATRRGPVSSTGSGGGVLIKLLQFARALQGLNPVDGLLQRLELGVGVERDVFRLALVPQTPDRRGQLVDALDARLEVRRGGGGLDASCVEQRGVWHGVLHGLGRLNRLFNSRVGAPG